MPDLVSAGLSEAASFETTSDVSCLRTQGGRSTLTQPWTTREGEWMLVSMHTKLIVEELEFLEFQHQQAHPRRSARLGS